MRTKPAIAIALLALGSLGLAGCGQDNWGNPDTGSTYMPDSNHTTTVITGWPTVSSSKTTTPPTTPPAATRVEIPIAPGQTLIIPVTPLTTTVPPPPPPAPAPQAAGPATKALSARPLAQTLSPISSAAVPVAGAHVVLGDPGLHNVPELGDPRLVAAGTDGTVQLQFTKPAQIIGQPREIYVRLKNDPAGRAWDTGVNTSSVGVGTGQTLDFGVAFFHGEVSEVIFREK